MAETCLEVIRFPSCHKVVTYQAVQLTSLFQPSSSLKRCLILLCYCRSFISHRRPSYREDREVADLMTPDYKMNWKASVSCYGTAQAEQSSLSFTLAVFCQSQGCCSFKSPRPAVPTSSLTVRVTCVAVPPAQWGCSACWTQAQTGGLGTVGDPGTVRGLLFSGSGSLCVLR